MENLTFGMLRVGVITLGCPKASISEQAARPTIQQLTKARTTEAQRKPSRAGQSLRSRSSPTSSTRLSTRHSQDARPLHVTTPKRDGGRSSAARHACSDKSKHAALTPQGPRGQQSPRLGQTPSLCHAAPTRQHRTTVATGTTPTVQIQTD